MRRPKLLDLFCGAGGAAMGYSRAGFKVTGVDIKPQPHYPFTFHQSDAFEYLEKHGHKFDVFHASPPCQGYSRITPMAHKGKYLDLIAPIRKALQVIGKPYVIENVPDARHLLRNPVMLCGSMFGLQIFRHRYFEIHPRLFILIPACNHFFHPVLITGCSQRYLRDHGRQEATADDRRAAIKIPWMSKKELDDAIPPAYTKFIGRAIKEQKLKGEDKNMARKENYGMRGLGEPPPGESGKGNAGEVKIAAPVVMMIKAEDLELGPNVRGKISDEKRKRFAENIRANKLDTPLTVEPKEGKTGKYIIRDGACRFLGGQDAGLSEFPCQVRAVGDVTTFQLRTTFREDFGAVQEAKAFRGQLMSRKMTLDELVLATGKEKVYIEKRLLLLNLDAEMQQAITDGKISAGHGYVLAQVGNESHRKKLFTDACRSKMSISSLIADIRGSETAWLKNAKFDKAECKKCPFAGLEAPDMFTQGDADEVKGWCTKPECFNEKGMAVLKEEAKKYPGITVKLTTEPSYHFRDKFPELKSSQHLYEHVRDDLGKAWKNNCLKCKSLLLIMNTSGDQEFHCLNPKCLRNLLPKEKGSAAGEDEMSGGGDIAEKKAENRVHFTRNDFLRKEIVKGISIRSGWESENAGLMIAVWCLVGERADKSVLEFLESKKLISAADRKKREEDEPWGYQALLLSHLVKFDNKELHEAVKFFSGKVVERDNPFDIKQLVDVSGVVKRHLTDFRVTEDYLNSMTKDELVKLAGEFKLPLPKGVMVPKLEKKGELVKFILEREPGKAPAEITKEDYREDEE